MNDGGFEYDGNVNGSDGRLTASVIITCIVAASGGVIFGYDIGISGGVTTMEPFLEKFFPSVLMKMRDATQSTYCVFDSQALTSFTSSLYLAGLVSSLGASHITKTMGRKVTMVIGGCTFLIGSIINGAAFNLVMLILGRILLGFGVGFTMQATPVYLSEMAPAKWRGTMNIGFELFMGIGVVSSSIINYYTSQLGDSGWRFSLGIAVVPASLMTLGALLVSDTPSSLVQRGRLGQARKALSRARGVGSDIEEELNELITSCQAAKEDDNPFTAIFERRYRPYLVMSIVIPFFQQLTGIAVVAFFAPILFRSIGSANNSALTSAIILGVVNLGSIVVSMFVVDRLGRRVLFMQGGTQMIISQVMVAMVLRAKVGVSGDQSLSQGYAILVLVLMCIYGAAFGWSWGPLTFLVPSEIFPMQIRPAGQSISIAVNFATTFVLTQTFLSMLCHMKYGVFLFYAGWVMVMTIFIALFLPETKGVPLESMHTIWERHWYWHRFSSYQSRIYPIRRP